MLRGPVHLYPFAIALVLKRIIYAMTLRGGCVGNAYFARLSLPF